MPRPGRAHGRPGQADHRRDWSPALPSLCENPLKPRKTLTRRVPHVRPTCPGVPWSVHGLNRMGDPDFLYAALDRTACAAFIKESRMKCTEADKLHRKSGRSALPKLSLHRSHRDRWSKSIRKRSYPAHVRSTARRDRWGEHGAPVLHHSVCGAIWSRVLRRL